MRNIPVDTSRITLVGTGKVAPKAEWVELSDGSRRPSGEQDRDDRGYRLWTVDVIVDDDDARRAEAVGVVVASMDEPVTPKWQPVIFAGLVASVYKDRETGQIKTSLKASGIEQPAVSGKQISAVS